MTLPETAEENDDAHCLHCRLTKVIEEHMDERITSGLETDMVDVTAKIVEALSQFLLEAIPDDERPALIAFTIEHLGRTLRSREESGTTLA